MILTIYVETEAFTSEQHQQPSYEERLEEMGQARAKKIKVRLLNRSVS